MVDDSAFMRYTITRRLQADPELAVVGSAQDGLDAIAKVASLQPDVITLDVEMPRMDGLTALKRIMAEHPTPVVMISSLTQRGARTTIQALMRGAVDFVAKPSKSADTQVVMDALVTKIKSAAGVRTETIHQTPVPDSAAENEAPKKVGGGLHPFRTGDPLVVIGTSTGGPRALQKVFTALPANLNAAMVVVQHMPPGFTKSLAHRLNEESGLTVQEAVDGDRLAMGLALLAPGDFHMRLGEGKRIRLDHGPRRNHVRPSVDVTMETAANIYGNAVIGVVLTGMGSDGTEGAGRIKSMGGYIIAEDEASSVVYGMPRSVAEAGYVDQVVPLPGVAAAITKMVNNGHN